MFQAAPSARRPCQIGHISASPAMSLPAPAGWLRAGMVAEISVRGGLPDLLPGSLWRPLIAQLASEFDSSIRIPSSGYHLTSRRSPGSSPSSPSTAGRSWS